MDNPSTFQDTYATWKTKYSDQLNPLTYRRYTNIAEKHLLPYFADTRMSDITDIQVSHFLLEKKAEGVSASTIRMALLVFRKILKEAGMRPVDTAFSEKTEQKNKKSNTVVMKREDIKVLEQHLRSARFSLCIGIFLSLKMGLTLGEICGLQWQDVDFDSETVRVCHMVQRVPNREESGPKTKLIVNDIEESGIREIPIAPSLIELLREKRKISGFVLEVGEHSMPDPRTEQWRFSKLLRMLHMQAYNYNVLRTTFAVRCIEAGMGMEDLSRLLGHMSVEITAKRYEEYFERNKGDMESVKNFMD